MSGGGSSLDSSEMLCERLVREDINRAIMAAHA